MSLNPHVDGNSTTRIREQGLPADPTSPKQKGKLDGHTASVGGAEIQAAHKLLKANVEDKSMHELGVILSYEKQGPKIQQNVFSKLINEGAIPLKDAILVSKFLEQKYPNAQFELPETITDSANAYNGEVTVFDLEDDDSAIQRGQPEDIAKLEQVAKSKELGRLQLNALVSFVSNKEEGKNALDEINGVAKILEEHGTPFKGELMTGTSRINSHEEGICSYANVAALKALLVKDSATFGKSGKQQEVIDKMRPAILKAFGAEDGQTELTDDQKKLAIVYLVYPDAFKIQDNMALIYPNNSEKCTIANHDHAFDEACKIVKDSRNSQHPDSRYPALIEKFPMLASLESEQLDWIIAKGGQGPFSAPQYAQGEVPPDQARGYKLDKNAILISYMDAVGNAATFQHKKEGSNFKYEDNGSPAMENDEERNNRLKDGFLTSPFMCDSFLNLAGKDDPEYDTFLSSESKKVGLLQQNENPTPETTLAMRLGLLARISQKAQEKDNPFDQKDFYKLLKPKLDEAYDNGTLNKEEVNKAFNHFLLYAPDMVQHYLKKPADIETNLVPLLKVLVSCAKAADTQLGETTATLTQVNVRPILRYITTNGINTEEKLADVLNRIQVNNAGVATVK